MTSTTKRKRMGWLERHFTFVMCVPLLIMGGIVLAYPLVEIVRISFYKWSILLGGIPEFAGISQYVSILKDQRFLNSVRVTLYFTGGALAISMSLGIGTALLLQKISKGRKLIISLLLLPFLACPMATGLIWKQMYEPSFSVFNYFLKIAHLPTSAWVFSSKAVIPSLILWDVWWGTPYVVVIVLGGLIMLPKEFFEQARIDGASSFQMFRYVTLPLIASTLLVALVLRVIATLKVFAPIYAMTEGGPGLSSESLYFYTYKLFTYGRIGYSAAVAIALFLLILVISIFLLRIMRGSR